jgi:multiple sugar transport system permease protein
MKRRIKASKAIVFILLFVGAVLSLVPFYWMVRSSFMDMMEIYKMPPLIWSENPTWVNYKTVFFAEIPFVQYLLNTLIIVVAVICGTLISSSISAYGFARFRFPYRSMWFALCISSMLIPGAVTLIPGFLIWKSIGMINTYGPLIIPSFFGGGAFNIFLFRQFFMTIPKELDEAARIDGAGVFRIYWQILIPQLVPVCIVVALFTFMGTWNDFFGPMLYLYDMSKYTVSLGLQLFTSSYGANYGAVMAGATVMTLPTIIIFFIGQKYFVSGIATTGLKA